MNAFFHHPLVWLLIVSLCIWLCTIVPIKMKDLDDQTRKNIYRWFLIPVSLVIILYAYPVGIELCKRLAIAWK